VHKNVAFEVVENMVMCLEPRIVLPDRPDVGGAHIEDVSVVTKEGYERLNATPSDDRLLHSNRFSLGPIRIITRALCAAASMPAPTEARNRGEDGRINGSSARK
jgi:hypothetical protein